MGLILCQWAKHLGATVIGTVSTDEKAELAKAHGADHVAVYSREDFVPLVMEVTEGKGCPVVYESIGKDTFTRSLDCLRPLGILASYGHASGAPDPVDVVDLGRRGSLFVTRPALMHYVRGNARTCSLRRRSCSTSSASGAVTITVRNRYPLREAAEVHRAIEERRTHRLDGASAVRLTRISRPGGAPVVPTDA